ncbi:MAG: DUF3500 domain-containing protein [Acidimicrobiales bacterium]
MAEAAAAAARAFVDLLDDAQAGDALLPFDEEERRAWAYWPAPRRGLPLWRLDRAQTKAVHRLLATLLPLPVHARVVAIMGLDEVLDRMEGYRGARRHSEDYWITLFGGPGDEVWGVRFEGHHVSVHATFGPDSGSIRLTPIFLGANPAVVHEAGRAVLAPLAAEERLGFELLHSLSSEQRAGAIVADRAPDDILTRNRPRLDDPLPPEGVPLTALDGAAAASARALLDVYLGRFPAGALRPDPADASFCWAGATEPGTGHYYRVAGPRLVIELDNTQNGANHVHTVVRHPLADFGDDVLAAHHRAAHGPPAWPGA